MHDKQLYYGTVDGRVCVNTGRVDGVLLDDPNTFSPIDWSLLTAFSDLGSPPEAGGNIRPLIRSDGATPSFIVEARYRYDESDVDPVSLVSGGDNTWDNGKWDSATWGGYPPTQEVRGAFGAGDGCGDRHSRRVRLHDRVDGLGRDLHHGWASCDGRAAAPADFARLTERHRLHPGT